MPEKSKVIILGAAGRDFHDFNVFWKSRDDVEVVCFTATQIPNIDGRTYPPELAGPAYPNGIPIHSETRLEELIRDHGVDQVTFAYSDVSYDSVMRLAARAQAAGASFRILGAEQTMLRSRKPVVAVNATRTGCGKSQTVRRVSELLREAGLKIAVVRHPMPYGDLRRQICQRFESVADMDAAHCTIEEREEYEPHIAQGNLVFAGVDYERILREAENAADVVLWDGGNNDLSFYLPDVQIVVADPHRAGHGLRYYPGETNLRRADLIIINKVDTAEPEEVARVEASIHQVNPGATVLRADSTVTVDDPGAIRGKRVLVVEDGPTLTHGEMAFGAGHVAAKRLGADTIVDPRPHAHGTIASVFEKYSHLSEVLPAMGYGPAQIAELEATIRAVPCDLVLIATPIDLGRLVDIDKPTVRVRYELTEHDPETLRSALSPLIDGLP